jgi:hypothetical protein
LSLLEAKIRFLQVRSDVFELVMFLKSRLVDIFVIRLSLRMNSYTIVCLFCSKSSHKIFMVLFSNWFIVTYGPLLNICSSITVINFLWVVSRVLHRHLVWSIRVDYLHISQFLNKWFSWFITNNSWCVCKIIILFRICIILLFLKLIEMSETVWGQVY